jgi:hypothetical protein
MRRKPKREFVPDSLKPLEERVVLNGSHGSVAELYAIPTLTSRTFNTSVSRINAAFSRAMGDYNRAFKAATRVALHQGEDVAVERLAAVGQKIGNRLARDLYAAPFGIPWGARDISPTLESIGYDVADSLSYVWSLSEAKTTGRDLFVPAQNYAVQTMHSIARESILSGYYHYSK